MLFVTAVLYALGALNLPFVRTLTSIPVFANASIIFAISGLSRRNAYLKAWLVPFLVQAVAGAYIFVSCFGGVSVLKFPHFAELTPSPLERALVNGALSINSHVVTTWLHEPVLEIYSRRLRLTFRIQPTEQLISTTDVGDPDAKPMAPQQIYVTRNGEAFLLHYTALWKL
jgi:hypothetical protein